MTTYEKIDKMLEMSDDIIEDIKKRIDLIYQDKDPDYEIIRKNEEAYVSQLITWLPSKTFMDEMKTKLKVFDEMYPNEI